MRRRTRPRRRLPPLYFFAINACSDTGCGATVGVVGGADGVPGAELADGVGAADDAAGVEEVTLAVDAGGAASSVLQATAAVITNATTPAHAIRRSIPSSLPSYPPNPVESSHNDCGNARCVRVDPVGHCVVRNAGLLVRTVNSSRIRGWRGSILGRTDSSGWGALKCREPNEPSIGGVDRCW